MAKTTEKESGIIINGQKYTERNLPHPNGPRSVRRRKLKKRCRRLREVRNKLMCGGECICDNMKKHRKKVRSMLQSDVLSVKAIMRATGTE